jgi:hypothetical protein
MSGPQERNVSSLDQLLAALRKVQVNTITVTEDFTDVRSLCLSPGQALRDREGTPTIRFRAGEDGLQLPSDNKQRIAAYL